jgi:methionine--tRNA ligase beta chain
MENISFSDFKRMDIRLGTVTEAEKAEGTDKLIKMQVDFGSDKRQIVASIAEFYDPKDLIGKQCPFLVKDLI